MSITTESQSQSESISIQAGKTTIDAWLAVPGWLSLAEGRMLQALATGRRVLELGCWCGRSTICMAATALHVVTVDAFEGDIFTGFVSTEDRARQEIAKSGLAHKITIDKADHFGYLPQDMFGMAFIDGAHDVYSVLRDIATCRPAMSPGGIMAFHDSNMASVKQGMRDIEQAGFQLGGEVDTLRWYYK